MILAVECRVPNKQSEWPMTSDPTEMGTATFASFNSASSSSCAERLTINHSINIIIIIIMAHNFKNVADLIHHHIPIDGNLNRIGKLVRSAFNAYRYPTEYLHPSFTFP